MAGRLKGQRRYLVFEEGVYFHHHYRGSIQGVLL